MTTSPVTLRAYHNNPAIRKGRPVIDLTGLVFGRLTAVRLDGYRASGNSLWTCVCTCGKAVPVGSSELRRGTTTSCGCYRRELSAKARTTHGLTGSPEHKAWAAMRSRCLNTHHQFFADYGGRGIVICPRWDLFENFLSDMGRRPSAKHSLERRDNNAGYLPENCCWATRFEQMNNTRATRLLTYLGRTQSVSLWCRELGLPAVTIRARIHRYGYSVERALSQPIRGR